MEGILRDILYAGRSLVRRPAFAATSILTLTVTLGFVTAVWSVVRGVLLAPLPYADADRLLVLRESHPEQGLEGFSAPTFDALRQGLTTTDAVAAYVRRGFAFTGGEEPVEVPSYQVTPELFPLLRADAVLGRVFSADEGVQGRDRVVVVSDAFWRHQLGGAGDVLGRVLHLDGEPYEVVGVMAPGFEFPPDSGARLWAALAFDPEDGHNTSRDVRRLNVLARRKADAGRTAVQGELDAFSAAQAAAHPDSMDGWSVRATGMHEQLVGGVRARLLLLLGAVGVLLVVAVTNLANLSLTQMLSRQREMAVRVGLGAGRFHLVRPFLAESLILSTSGALGALAVAAVAVRWVGAFSPGVLPRQGEVALDAGVVLFAFAVAGLVASVFGLLPAWQHERAHLRHSGLVEHLRSGHAAPIAAHRMKSTLVVAQVALAFTLTVGAGLLLRSFARLTAVEPGFRTDGVLVANVSLPGAKYRERHLRRAFYDTVIAELRATPGIESAGAISALPMDEVSVNFDVPFEIEGGPPRSLGEEPRADFRVVLPGYFATLGIPLTGRAPDGRDHAEGSPVVWVNETLARRFFADTDPVGRFISFPMGGRREIVGVAADVRHYGLANEPRPELYLPHAQQSFATMVVVARTDGGAGDEALRRAVGRGDPEQAIRQLTTLAELLDKTLFLPRLQTVILTLFAACSIFLAVVGLYGLLAAWVAERTREIGVRMALGAQGGDVMRLVIRQGMALAVAGIVTGLLLSAALTRTLGSLLYEVDPLDPAVLLAVALGFAVVALGANSLPALRATRVEASVALAAE